MSLSWPAGQGNDTAAVFCLKNPTQWRFLAPGRIAAQPGPTIACSLFERCPTLGHGLEFLQRGATVPGLRLTAQQRRLIAAGKALISVMPRSRVTLA